MRRYSVVYTLLTLLVFAAFATGCASTSKMEAPSPAGTWSYVILSTPQGDATGDLMVTLEDGAYRGEISSDMLMQTVPISEVSFQDSTFAFAAAFDLDGQLIDTVTEMYLNGDAMNGTMTVTGFGEFVINAMRKVEE
ncbi:MAG: hypothetical protein ACE5G0_02535 [Rhodothermales bacterium]